MLTSQYLLSTLKEVSTDSKIISHRLMLRAGMIRKLASGLYTWLPTGLRVLKKIENIIREEMNNIGSIEISMPIIQPANLWKESGRLEQYGPELLHFFDRSDHPLILSPTCEEAITNLISKELNSYKQLPLIFFQIQKKFRDEIRPRFGVIRSREFLMKDAYSFHISKKSLQETYDKMYTAYKKIFTHMKLNFQIVQSDNGLMGGNISHEFQVPIKISKDKTMFSNSAEYNKNIKYSTMLTSHDLNKNEQKKLKLVSTSNVKNTFELAKKYNLPIEKTVKTLLVKAEKKSKYSLIALLIRGDHELNKIKVSKLSQVAKPVTLASAEEIRAIINSSPEFLGPINMPTLIFIDRTVAVMKNFIAGANMDGKYYFNINWNRDIAMPEIADIHHEMKNSSLLDKEGNVIINHGIEVGHLFQLGKKYSKALNAAIQGQDGYRHTLTMGCYGIGITRVVAAIIEQNHDKKGIIWPDNVAPFQIAILPINMYKSYRIRQLAEKLYFELHFHGIEVIMDDRKEHPGVMFADMELIGIPYLIILSEHNLSKNCIEYKYRRNDERKLGKTEDILDFLIKTIKNQSASTNNDLSKIKFSEL